MRHDKSGSPSRNEPMGLGAILTGYVSLALILLAFAALIVAGHRHAAAPKQTGAGDAYFGSEELVDLFGGEIAMPPAGFAVLPKPRPMARADVDPS